MGKLDGKIALVTGGTTGIGFATARLFRDEGARVIATGRNADRVAQARKELGKGVDVVIADAARKEDTDALFVRLARDHGRLDVLFLNAGVEEQDVEPAVIARQSDEQGVGIFLARGVGDHHIDAFAQLFARLCDPVGVPARGDDACAFVAEEPRRSKSDAGRPARDQRNLAVELPHRSLRNVTV